jgi:hypothetical protein
MGMMFRLRRLLIVAAMLGSLPVFSQDPPPTPSPEEAEAAAKRQEAIQREQEMEATSRAFDRMAEEARSRPPTSSRSTSGFSERQKFFETVRLFRQATTQYRESIGLDPDITKPVRSIEKLIDPLKSYFNHLKVKGTTVDRSEYENLSQKDLAWEALTLAETIDNNLQIAQRIVSKSDREGVVDIKSLQFFGDIQNDLTRLSLLTARIVRK